MDPPDGLVPTVPVIAGALLALGAAVAYGASSLLQFRASHRLPEEPVGRVSLLAHLLRLPGWRWSLVLAAAAFALQVVALGLAPLTVVQPLLITGLLWYILLYFLAERMRPDPPTLREAGLCLAGLAAFLLLAAPRGREAEFGSFGASLLLVVAVVVSVALCMAVAVRLDHRWRPLPLALGAGICYGVTAGLVSSLVFEFHQSPLALLGQWQTYAVVVLGPFGVLLSQNAYQAGPVGAPALATIIVSDPLVSILVGLLWLQEQIRTGWWAAVGLSLSLAVVAVAVFLLARRAPHVRGG